MQTMIWAFGSMLVLLLIISILPLGFTFKGKFFVVSAAFFLALGGLAATEAFLLWQSTLILVVLIFFTAYMMDSRLGNALYKEHQAFEKEMIEMEASFSSNSIETKDDLDLQDLAEIEIVAPSLIKSDQNMGIVTDLVEEDISFLHERDVEGEIDEKVADSEHDYLNEMDESEFDYLFAANEDDNKGEVKSKEKLELQKN